MKILSADGLTKLIQLCKSTFIKNTDTEVVSELSIDNAPTSGSTNLVTSGGVYSGLSNKQDTLVSGTNIKTINNQSLLGSGNITVSTSLSNLSDTTITSATSGQFLKYDGSKWVNEGITITYE